MDVGEGSYLPFQMHKHTWRELIKKHALKACPVYLVWRKQALCIVELY